MRFQVDIITTDGGHRQAEFESVYDATALLVEHVEREVLADGETIASMPSPHPPRERREAYVPAIYRTA